jgi:hypothetical protein
MHYMKRTYPFFVFVTLGACGGGGGSLTPPPPPVVNASPGGIWNGTDSLSGLSVEGLVTETGEFHFIRSDLAQYIGTVSVSGNAISGNLQGFAEFGTAFPDGSTHGTGTITGTVSERSTLNVSISFKTDAGTSTSTNVPLTFNALYNNTSSLATISGNYTEASTGTVFSVSGNGTVFAQDAADGCVVNGTISIIDTSYNAYDVSYTYSSCVGPVAVLNGVTATGLATLNTTVSPAQAIVAVSGTVGTQSVALVEALNKM